MTDTQMRTGTPQAQRVAAPQARAYDEPTGWVGWLYFAGTMMIIGGILNAFYGVVALVNDNWVVWQNRTAVLLDLTGWGWVHIAVGAVVALAGLGLFSGRMVARVVAVVVAGIGMAVNFMFIPVYPLWAITVVTINALVIWAVLAHGREAKTAREIRLD